MLLHLLGVALCALATPAQSREFPVRRANPSGAEAPGGAFGMAVDQDGFLWVATRCALLRFDGVETRTFVTELDSMRLQWTVQRLLIGSDGTIWVPSGSGLMAFDPATETFTLHSPDGPESTTRDYRVASVAEDKRGRIWACTNAGIALLDRTTRTYTHRALDPGDVPDPDSRASRAVVDAEGKLWLGTIHGIVRFDPETGESRRFALEPDDISARLYVFDLIWDDQRYLWVATSPGLYRFDTQTGVAVKMRADIDHIRSMTRDALGRLWVGTRFGAVHALGSDGGRIGLADGLETAVRCLVVDSHHRLWIATSKGIWIADAGSGFVVHRLMGSDRDPFQTRSIRAMDDGEVWCCVIGGGLISLPSDGSTGGLRILPADGSARADVSDGLREADGTEWIVLDWAVHRLRDGHPERVPFPTTDSILFLYTDAEHNLLASTTQNLYRASADRSSWSLVPHGEPIIGSLPPEDGGFWFKAGRQFLRWLPSTNEVRSFPLPSLPGDLNRPMVDHCPDGHGGLLLVGARALWQLDANGECRELLLASNAFDEAQILRGVLRDSLERIWVWGANAITAFEPGSGVMHRFGTEHGLPRDANYRSYGVPVASGEVLIGSQRRVVRFDPSTVLASDAPPRVILIEHSVGDTRFPTARVRSSHLALDLSHDDDLVSFRVAAVLEPRPDDIEYSFRLDGLQDTWRSNGHYRDLTLANLPGGDYRLAVRARRPGQPWSSPRTIAELHVAPPFWHTWWFRGGTIALLATILLGLHRLRVRGMKQRAEVLRERAHLSEERVALQERLEQSRRMEAIGRLAGGVSHDFNNILTAMLGQIELIQDSNGDESVGSLVEELLRSCERGADITRQLLTFSRRNAPEPRVFDPGPVVRDLTPLLQQLIREDIELVVHAPDGAGCILTDPGQFEQIVVNLVANARDAMPSGGQLTIELAASHVDQGSAPCREEVRNGTYVILSVADTGCGMGPETMLRIFEPFFTTKDIGNGTGLGLASVDGIVRQYGGFVAVGSELKNGSVFRIHLPSVAAPEPAFELPAQATPPSPPAPATILVCDDFESVRTVAARLLERHGHEVLVAETPRDALRLAAEHETSIDLLVTDVIMPDMNGVQLAAALRAERNDVRVLYMSGYTADVLATHGEIRSEELIQKPFALDDLLARVTCILSSTPAAARPSPAPATA